MTWRDAEAEWDGDDADLDEGPQERDLAAPDDGDESETVACPECGADVYEDAERCPACGAWIIPRAGGGGRRGWLVALGLLLAATMVLWAIGL